MVTKDEIERLRIQAQAEIEIFVKDFVNKYRPIFTQASWKYRVHPSLIPEIYFPYDVYLEIKIENETS